MAGGFAVQACDRGTAAARNSTVQDDALRALADSLLPDLERLSGLGARSPIALERRRPEQVREFVEKQLAEELPPEELDGIRHTYALLGLIPDSLDLRQLLLDLYAEQIVGYYDPAEKKLFVIEGVPAAAVRPVLAHELVHALQDQYTDLDSLIARERGNDRQTAAQSALEGHATLVMFALLAEEAAGTRVDASRLPDPEEQLRPALESANSQFPVFRTAPFIIRETLLFPYVSGARFVRELWRSQPVGEHAAPLGELLPQSTEQVMDPTSRFLLQRDEPSDVHFADESGWEVIYENGFGMLEIGILLQQHLGAEAAASATGWDGDRYRLLRAPDGRAALTWHSVWDDDVAADRFAQAMRRVIQQLGREGEVTRMSLEEMPGVTVVISEVPLAEVPRTSPILQTPPDR